MKHRRTGARRAGSIAAALWFAIAPAAPWSARAADGIPAAGERRTLTELSGPLVHRCEPVNCATILSIQRLDTIESPNAVATQGPIQRQPPFGPYDPRMAPINQPSFHVQRREEGWAIQVQRHDGSVQWIRQSYPVLFQVGDQVLIEAGRLRAPD